MSTESMPASRNSRWSSSIGVEMSTNSGRLSFFAVLQTALLVFSLVAPLQALAADSTVPDFAGQSGTQYENTLASAGLVSAYDATANDPNAAVTSVAPAVGTVIPASVVALRGSPLPAQLPVLLLHGTRDPVVDVSDARAVAAELPNAHLVEFDCLHDLLNDVEHRAVASTIVSFVDQHGTTGT